MVDNAGGSRDEVRGELVKLRTGLARLAFTMGLGQHVPGVPSEVFEDIAEAAERHERGWNALVVRMMDVVGVVSKAEHDARLDAIRGQLESLQSQVLYSEGAHEKLTVLRTLLGMIAFEFGLDKQIPGKPRRRRGLIADAAARIDKGWDSLADMIRIAAKRERVRIAARMEKE